MKIAKYKVALIIVSILFFLGLGYMLSKIDWLKAYDLFLNSNLFFLIAAFFVMVASILVKIIRFKFVTKYFDHKLNFRNSALIQMFGICVAMVTPGRLGEASKIYLLYRKGIRLSISMSIMIFERLIDLFVLTGFGVLFAIFVVQDARLNALLTLIIVLTVILIFLLRYPRLIVRIIPKRFEMIAKHLRDLKFGGHFWTLILVVVLSILTWSLEGAVQWVFAMGMGVDVSLFSVIAILGVSTVLGLLSFLPAGVGAMDFSVLFLYSIIGVPAEAAISLLLVARVFGTLMPYIYAIVLMYYYKIPLSKVKSLLKLRESKFSIEGEGKPIE
ncbi:flippase-like domain-containing protein [Candidatus Woesearchaeota archaeon]|nr:flippase-like domain-containing protein [Candidatus Woesearchaeota archaeon]MBW3022168.1 flippase-like domain-containing protein [Candidatus Woesearchaeota archaeon]